MWMTVSTRGGVAAWPRGGGPRRAAVSAFGMGGANAHVIVEEPPEEPRDTPLPQDSHIVRVSATDEAALRDLAASYADHLAGTAEDRLGDFARTANTARTAHRYRTAAHNVPRVHTISGPEELMARFRERSSFRVQPLKVSHAFHSAVMEPALAPFADAVAATRLAPPAIPFASALTGTWHSDVTATDPGHWAQAIRRTVRFGQAVTTLAETGPHTVWEIGPHPQLTPLARATLAEARPDLDPAWITTLQRGREEQPQFHAALSAHHNHTGTDLNWAALHRGKHQNVTTVPGYPFRRRRFWIAPGAPDAPGPDITTTDSNHPHETKRPEHHG